MDYDDNDFQGKNLHIAGEGSNKYPPVLQPYALPKFDFDDSLNGHLRFENLVETEAFLGIEGNEDNHWIEDFSRGSSSVVFRSSAAESCAVPRHDNVWSEATSSESVEMLLKAVGQDEVITEENTIKRSDDCDELGCIIKQMEPGSKHDDNKLSKVEAVALPPVPPDGASGGCSGLEEGVGFHQCLDRDASHIGEADSSGDGEHIILDATVSGGNKNIISNPQDLSEKMEVTHDPNVSETVMTEALGNRKTEESCAAGTQKESVTVVQSTVAISTSSNSQEAFHLQINVEDTVTRSNDSGIEGSSVPGSSFRKDVQRFAGAEGSSRDLSSSEETLRLNSDQNDRLHKNGNGNQDGCLVVDDDPSKTGELVASTDENNDLVQPETMLKEASDINFMESDSQALDSKIPPESSDQRDSITCTGSAINDQSGDTLPRTSSDVLESNDQVRDARGYPAFEVGENSRQLTCAEHNSGEEAKNLQSDGEGAKMDISNLKVPLTSLEEMKSSSCKDAGILGGYEAGICSSNVAFSSPDVTEKLHVTDLSVDGNVEFTDAGSESIKKGAEQRELPKPEKVPCDSSCPKQVIGGAENSGDELTVISERPEKVTEGEKQEEGVQKNSERDANAFRPVTSMADENCDSIGTNAGNKTVTEGTNVEQVTLPSTSGSAKFQESTGSAQLLEPVVESHVIKSGEIPADSINQSPSVPAVHTSEPSQGRDGTKHFEGISDHSLSTSLPVEPLQAEEKDSLVGDKNPTSTAVGISEKQSVERLQLAPQAGDKSGIHVASSSTIVLEKNEQKPSKDASDESLQVVEKEKIRSTTKGTPERKARRASKSAGKEISKKSNTAKETPPTAPLPSGTWTSSNAVFQRPFTDLQQVQLRAQIFVYGALIQGTIPDEAYMISAFGGHDGGRSMWENAWRNCMQRIHTQKLNLVSPETPLHLHSVVRAPDQNTRSVIPSKASSPAVGRACGKGTSIASPVLPLSSPLWGIPTPRDTFQSNGMPRGPSLENHSALSSFQSHQTPVKNMGGHNTSWLSPTFVGPWIASPQANFDTSSHFSLYTISEMAQSTPVKELSVSHSLKHLLPGPVVNSGTTGSATKLNMFIDPKKAAASPVQSSVDSKSRKRRKTPLSEELIQSLSHSQAQIESVSVPFGGGNIPASVSNVSPTSVAQSSQEKIITSSSPLTLNRQLTDREHEVKQSSIFSERTHVNLKEARMHAEQAADIAAAAVSQSQEVWRLIEKENGSRHESDVEKRLASAAITIAAAAAVAKAAAAAANVATNAALQTKLMAEETLPSSKCSQGIETVAFDCMRNLGKATPASILSVDSTAACSNSVLTAAREAARKRVEAATAATKQAENVDAILRAAELAAEAVSQAGKIVAMSDPLPLAELLKGGPDSFWKVPIMPHKMDKKSDYPAIPPGISTELEPVRPVDHTFTTGNSMMGHRKLINSDSAKAGIMMIDSDNASVPQGSAIREGSHVEVFKEGDGFKAAWYSANVLSLKDGNAYVCYADLSSAKDTGKLKEWVSIEAEVSKAPIIRPARSTIAMPFEGTRKRRREATGDNTWVVGDRVDAWVKDSWWEGVITEKKRDETTLTVHFAAQGETLTVSPWHLRPSLVWKDGKWSESLEGNKKAIKELGDTPHEKRPRLESPCRFKSLDKNGKVAGDGELMKPHQTGSLDLGATERTFNIGTSTKANSKPSSLKMPRSGLQKEGSRVVFGVPKPGKKRKFMEVSKHYVAEPSNKVSEPKDTAKFTRHLVPQPSGSRAWKNVSKANPKEKRAAASKAKVMKPGKALGGASIRLNSKENVVLKTGFLGKDFDGSIGLVKDDVSSVDHEEKTSSKHNLSESRSISGADGVEECNSQDVSSGATEKNSLGSIAERGGKGKIASSGGRLARIVEGKVSNESFRKGANDSVEPRRSNRRIQPTSRLLEGLQSSMIISKIPSTSHEKGQKVQSRSGYRGK